VDDGDAMATALMDLLGDRERAARFGQAGREDAVRKFGARAMVERLEAFYEARLRARGAAS
jgi:glycosyltransferase involved in cell wall biosynthesis